MRFLCLQYITQRVFPGQLLFSYFSLLRRHLAYFWSFVIAFKSYCRIIIVVFLCQYYFPTDVYFAVGFLGNPAVSCYYGVHFLCPALDVVFSWLIVLILFVVSISFLFFSVLFFSFLFFSFLFFSFLFFSFLFFSFLFFSFLFFSFLFFFQKWQPWSSILFNYFR